jgi:outer membrane immunogenic protein
MEYEMSNRVLAAAFAGIAALGMVSAASAADLLVNNAPSYDPVSPAGAWDGLWLGVYGGYGWATFDDSENYFGDVDSLDADGFLLGVNATANFSLGNGIVLGAITDLAWSNLTGEQDTLSYSVDWQASARGKIGYDAGTFLPYLTAGLAVAGATVDEDGYEDSQMHVGWTAGAGVDVALTESINLTAEYRYSDYGTSDYDLDGNATLGLSTSTITAGVSFKF